MKEYRVTQIFNRGKFRETKSNGWDADVNMMNINPDDNKNTYCIPQNYQKLRRLI